MGTGYEPVLRAAAVTKRYGAVQALDAVDFEVAAGEVRALLGKNGAGKSTLVEIMSGAIRPDAGRIFRDGTAVSFGSPADAQRHGVATVHQELSLVPGLTVAENIMLGRWRQRRIGPVRLIDRKAGMAEAAAALERLGEQLPLGRLAGTLSLGQQQVVEIAKAISYGPVVLILDEPTSALNAHEVDALIALVRRLAAGGVTVVYVSHRMQELPRVADSFTVLRDGCHVRTGSMAEASGEEIAELITGPGADEPPARVAAVAAGPRPTALAVRDLRQPGLLEGIDFDVARGEVVGLAGVLGSGRTEILQAIYGLNPAATGVVEVAGKPITRRSPRRMLACGVGLTPEDRQHSGLVLDLPIAQNLAMASPARVGRLGVVSARAERRLAEEQVASLAIRAPSIALPARSLSGGNQQKVVIGKLLGARTRVLLLDEPTRGVDIGAKRQIYRIVRKLTDEGAAVVFVSSELEELTLLCDRILVLNGGRITAELAGHEADPGSLLALAVQQEAA